MSDMLSAVSSECSFTLVKLHSTKELYVATGGVFQNAVYRVALEKVEHACT